MRFLIDRNELPYDAMVSDPSQLIPIDDEEGEDTDDKEAEEMAAQYAVEKQEFLSHFGGLETVKYDIRMRKALAILSGEEIK